MRRNYDGKNNIWNFQVDKNQEREIIGDEHEMTVWSHSLTAKRMCTLWMKQRIALATLRGKDKKKTISKAWNEIYKLLKIKILPEV